MKKIKEYTSQSMHTHKQFIGVISLLLFLELRKECFDPLKHCITPLEYIPSLT